MSAIDDNISRAQKYMQRFATDGVNNHINGKDLPAQSGKTFEINSPVDLCKLADVSSSDASDIDAAAQAATLSLIHI